MIALGDAVDVDARGADQSQRAKPARAPNGDFGRDPSAERMADEMHLIEAERVDEIEIEIGKVGKLVQPVRRIGPAEAGMIRHDHVVALRQRRHERQPDADPAARHAGTAAGRPCPRASHSPSNRRRGRSRVVLEAKTAPLAHAVDRREPMNLPVRQVNADAMHGRQD